MWPSEPLFVLWHRQLASLFYQPCPIQEHQIVFCVLERCLASSFLETQVEPTISDASCLVHTYSVPKGMVIQTHRFPLLSGSSLFNTLKRLGLIPNPHLFTLVQSKPHLDMRRSHWKPTLRSLGTFPSLPQHTRSWAVTCAAAAQPCSCPPSSHCTH